MRFEGNKIDSKRPHKEGICAVIVTYHPDAGFYERAALIASQVGSVVVVDNHSTSSAVSMLGNLQVSQQNVHLVLNEENLGVATALNQGVHLAREQGYGWVLLFDQDTVPESFMVNTLVSVYDSFDQKDKLAIIGSNYRDANTRRAVFESGADEACLWAERKTVITSGSLLSLAAFEAIGPFRDEFFIDCVDIDYCLRARSKGFKIILTCRPIIGHALGAATMHRLPWKESGTSNHSPVRRYYLARNYTVLAREYLLKEPRWVFATSYLLIKSCALILLFESDKVLKLRYWLLGVWHGLTGKSGKR